MATGDVEFGLDTTYSVNTGEYFAILSKSEPPASGTVGALFTRLISLDAPVVPDGYEFSIFDKDGVVKFDSHSDLNDRVNVFHEWDDDQFLRAAAENRDSRPFNGEYQGVNRRAFARPLTAIANTGWTVLVYYDLSMYEDFLLDSLILAFIASLTFAAICMILIGVAALGFYRLWLRKRIGTGRTSARFQSSFV